MDNTRAPIVLGQMSDPKQVKKFLQMLRSEGVTDFKGMGIEVTLGPLPEVVAYEPEVKSKDTEPQLSDEELLMWSSGAISG